MKKRKFGDRKDGVWLKNLDGMHLIMPFLMPKRTEAEVYLEEQVDVTGLLKYVDKRNEDNKETKTTPFHLFVTAIAKTVYFRPYLNRFIAGNRIYQRNHISIAFVVKRKFEDKAEELLLIMRVKPENNLDDVQSRILGDSKKLRKEGTTNVGDMMDVVGKFPRWINRIFFALVRFVDYHGWMPESVTSGDPDFSSVLVSNLGSIKCNAAYHHLNNYGTNSVLITIGNIHKAPIVNENGEIEIKDVVNFGCTVDERIADGFYFAKSVRFIKYLLANPELLEQRIDTEVEYEF